MLFFRLMEKLQCVVLVRWYFKLSRIRMFWEIVPRWRECVRESKIEVLLGVLGVGSYCDTIASRVEEQV